MKKRYFVTYTFNGQDCGPVVIENLFSCLESFCMASQAGQLEHVTITSNNI